MNNSMAAKLQNAVLKIASQTGTGLDLSRVGGAKAAFEPLQEGTIQPGERVLIVGAGEADLVFTAAKQAGPAGSVLILESADAPLHELSDREAAEEAKLGVRNWRIVRNELDDLRTEPSYLNEYLSQHPVVNADSYRDLQNALLAQRTERPLAATESVDVVLLDTVANRLPESRLSAALNESFRVLRKGGRLILRTLLADETGLPLALPALASGQPMQYAPLETEIITRLDAAGFHGMTYVWRAELPSHVAEGVELRAFVLTASKGKQGICLDQGHAVIYKGPWSEVFDDDGHRFVRGERTAVCEKTYNLLMRAPYQGEFFGVPCYTEIPLAQAPLFDCNTPQLRDPQVTKGKKSVFDQDAAASACCPTDSGSGCC